MARPQRLTFGRTTARALVRRAPRPALRVVLRNPSLGRPVGTFRRDDGRPLPLLGGYRDAVKASWRLYWPPTQVLLGLRRRVEVPRDADELALAIEAARTLPVPLAEVESAVAAIAPQFPGHVRPLPGGGFELLAAEDELERRARSYRAVATEIAAAAAARGIAIPGARVLEVGSGSAYLSFALAGLGAEVTALDLDPESYVFPGEREATRAFLEGEERRATLVGADVHALPFEDASFDLVVSMTALEHFRDLRLALRELARVLRPGGVMRHGVDPWFGIRGGHSLCTLDIPWGHVRLGHDELERYLHELRAHEAADGIADLRGSFQAPPLTLAESREAVTAAGLELLAWDEVQLPSFSRHRAVFDRRLLRECRKLHPSVTARDLLTLTYTLIAHRDR